MLDWILTLFIGWNLIAGTGAPPADLMAEHECVTAIWDYQSDGKWVGYFRLDQPRSTYEQSLYEDRPMDPARAYWVYCAANE